MRPRRAQRGMVLILVLWAIAVLALIAGGLCFAMRQTLALSSIDQDTITAHWLARAGVERAIAAVMDDLMAFDTQSDLWFDDPTQMRQIEFAAGTFSVVHDDYEPIPAGLYGVADESAKLNISVATRAQLMKLPDMTDPIAAAIIDWRDRNEEPEPDGIERSFYAGLGHPYTIRNGPFRTVRELLLVRGVTDELFYGEDLNLNGLLDPNEDDGEANPPNDNADGRLDRGWAAYVTVYSYEKNVDGEGRKRLNLKNADANTLAQRLTLETWAAKSIVKAREKKQFQHLVDLLDVRRDPSTADDDEEINVRDEADKDTPVTKRIFQRIVDKLTLKDAEVLWGRINVNTAPQVVLETLPGVDNDLADAIVRYRYGYGGFQSVGDLLDVTGMTKKKFAKFEEHVAIRTYVFRIQSTGHAASGLAKATIDCVVDRGQALPRMMYWLESSP